ncbi:MAG: gluzincin family metallopeptidase [Myxococcales bacterium]
MPTLRPITLLALCGCFSSCRRAPRAAAPTRTQSLPVFVDRTAPGQIVEVGQDSSPPSSLEVGRIFTSREPPPLRPPEPPSVPPPVDVPIPPPDGVPTDGVDAVLTSLQPAERGAVPNPATLPFYDIQLRVDPADGRISGTERIDYPNSTAAPLRQLPLRIFANAGESLVNVDSVSEGGVPLPASSEEPSIVEVPLPSPLSPGAWVHLAVAFHGRAPEPHADSGQEGMLQSLLAAPGRSPDYGLFSRFEGGIALAEFLPMVAGRWKGAFDLDPGNGVGDASFFDLSSFRASIDLPADFVLAAQGVTLSEELLPGRRRRTQVALADARDFTLFASNRYREADAVENGIRVRSLYENGQGDPGRSVLDTARKALALFGRLWHDYPWATFTAVEVPLRGGAGGAEFPSLVAVAGLAYGAGSLPGGMQFSPGFQGEMREFVVAHEVAHQWWACAVASHPRAEPDVDEPLAQYAASVYIGAEHGPQARRAALDSQVAVNYQTIRMLGIADGPAARATGEFRSSGEYAGLVYGKAPFFYLALEDKLGEAGVSRGLAEYARRHWMGLARRGEVVAAVASASYLSARELQPLFDRWFRERHGDVDLAGRGDVMSIAAQAFGSAGGLDLGQLLDQAPQAMQQIQQLQQGGGAPAAPGNLPAIDPQQAMKLLKQLNQTMGGLDEGN